MRAAWMTASRPDRQTLDTISAGVVHGRPALMAVWRAGFWPAPARMTWPRTTRPTSSGLIPARSTAARTAWAPRSTEVMLASWPSILPCGVRAPARMTTSSAFGVVFPVMVFVSLWALRIGSAVMFRRIASLARSVNGA